MVNESAESGAGEMENGDSFAEAVRSVAPPVYLPRMHFLLERLKITSTELHLAHAQDPSAYFPDEKWDEFLWLFENVQELHDLAIKNREAIRKKQPGGVPRIDCIAIKLDRDGKPIAEVTAFNGKTYENSGWKGQAVFRFVTLNGQETIARVLRLGRCFEPRMDSMGKRRYWYLDIISGHDPRSNVLGGRDEDDEDDADDDSEE
jgi:hypothetical protein